MGDNRGVNGFWRRTRRDQGSIFRIKYESLLPIPECGEALPSDTFHDGTSERRESDADGGPEGEYSWMGNDPVVS